MLPRLKPIYREEVIKILRKVLKDNTVDISIIDLQATVIAFSLRKFSSYLESSTESYDEQQQMRAHIFKETAAVMQDLYDTYTENPNNDAREWYDSSSEKLMSSRGIGMAERMSRIFFERVESGAPINSIELISMLNR